MDVALRASLMQDAGIPMPEPKVLARWSKAVAAKLDKLLPHDASFRGGRLVAVKGWRGEIEVESRCAPDGRLLLNGVEVSAYQVVNPPRVFDEPDRRERPIEKQLGDLARRFKRAFDAWMGCVADLRKSLDLPAVHFDRQRPTLPEERDELLDGHVGGAEDSAKSPSVEGLVERHGDG